MAELYFPFATGDGADVSESKWSAMARLWLTSGVVPGYGNELALTPAGGLTVDLNTGTAWVAGHYYENDAAGLNVALDAADGSNPRIDIIVIRVDWIANTIDAGFVKGTPGATPAAPLPLTRDSATWEIEVGRITVDTA